MQAQVASDSLRRMKEGRGAYLSSRLQTYRASGCDRPPAKTRSSSPLPHGKKIGQLQARYKDASGRSGGIASALQGFLPRDLAQLAVRMSFSFMYLLYSALLAAGLLISLPYWVFGKRRHGKYREGLDERLGRVRSRLRGEDTQAIWVHVVSVGKVPAVGKLVSGFILPSD